MKAKSYATLKRKLDAVFSEWTRRRAAVNGMASCVTCRKVSRWKEMQCGHFIPRHYLAGRWNPENTAVQCPSCNIWGRGRYPEFAQWGINHYGQDWLSTMVALKRKPVKYRRGDLEAMIEEYTEKLKRLP